MIEIPETLVSRVFEGIFLDDTLRFVTVIYLDLVNHASVTSTQIYSHLLDESLEEALDTL